MGVDTRLFIGIKNENKIQILKQSVKILNDFVREFKTKNNLPFHYSELVRLFSYNGETFVAQFSLNETESRELHINLLCDSDYSDTYKGTKIIFSLGHWGHSKEIMKFLGERLLEFSNKVYYVGNDYDDDWIKITKD